MRCMERNKQLFYYATFNQTTPHVDEYGNETGEFDITFNKPIPFRANISPAKGETETQVFGNHVDYDKMIVIEQPFPPITEETVLWIDQLPELDSEGKATKTHDYIVKKKAESLNSLSLAISKVNVR